MKPAGEKVGEYWVNTESQRAAVYDSAANHASKAMDVAMPYVESTYEQSAVYGATVVKPAGDQMAAAATPHVQQLSQTVSEVATPRVE